MTKYMYIYIWNVLSLGTLWLYVVAYEGVCICTEYEAPMLKKNNHLNND